MDVGDSKPRIRVETAWMESDVEIDATKTDRDDLPMSLLLEGRESVNHSMTGR